MRKRTTTNFFSAYNRWFEWLKIHSIGKQEFPKYFFVNYRYLGHKNKKIHFTEYAEFPIMSDNELVIPIIDKGWTRENTTAYLLKENTINRIEKGQFTREKIEAGIGRNFSLSLLNEEYSYHSGRCYHQCMLVLIQENTNTRIKKAQKFETNMNSFARNKDEEQFS